MIQKKSIKPEPHKLSLEEFIQSVPLGMHFYFLKDNQLVFNGANHSADKILGISHKELIGQTIEEAFPPLADTEIPEEYRKVALTGKSWEAEQVIYQDEHISGVFQVFAFQLAPKRIGAMFVDITAKKKAEEELQKSLQSLAAVNKSLLEMQVTLESKNFDLAIKEQTISGIFKIAPVGIGLTKDLIFTHINDKFAEITGYAVAELMNQPVKLLFASPAEYQRITNQVHDDFIRHGTSGTETVWRTKDGRDISILLNSSPVDVNDLSKGIIFIALDITAQKIVMSELQQKNEEFMQLNKNYAAQNETLQKTNSLLEESNRKLLDITRKIKSSSQQLRIILENSKDIIYSINYQSGLFEYISPIVKEILGLPDTHFINQPPDHLYSLMHPDDYKSLGNHWLEVIEMEEKEIYLFEISYRLKDVDGQFHWMSENNKLVRDDEGKPVYLIGSIRDYTEIKKSELALKSSEERLSLALEATNQGLWDINLENNAQYYSPACFSMLGYEPGDVPFTAETLKNLIHPSDKEPLIKQMYDFFMGDQQAIAVEFRIKNKSGDYVWILSHGKVFERNSNGKAVRIVGTHRDITERKLFELALKQKNEELLAAEEELRAANDELLMANEKLEMQNEELQLTYEKLKESDRLKSIFLANISHEIRTPMNGIIGFANLLSQPDLPEQKRNHYIDIINKSSSQLLHIIEDIVDISKIEANQLQITFLPFDVNELINELHTIYTRELSNNEKSDIHLIPVYGNANSLKIVSDGLRIRQVMTNLINNAIKFTEKGYIKFGYEIENPQFIRFFVEDTGIGIDKSMFDIIFEPFRQVDEGDTRKYGGAGLGLPIARGLVKLLHGEMWLESVKDKGTTFFFRIPYNKYIDDDKPESMPVKDQQIDWSNKIILIVEDDNMNYEFLEALLSPTGVIIERAKNGIQALTMCEKKTYDLIIMDIRLPLLDGIKATKQMRKAGIKTPIIAQTAYAMMNDRDKCLEAGCDDYIAKPVNKNLLFKILTKYI